MTEVSVSEMTMSYEGLVEAGREARKQADSMQWTEGDLALQVDALPAQERPRDEDGLFIEDEAKTLQRYAEDVDISYSTIKNYRATAQAWPSVRRRTEVSYGVHEALAAQSDRFNLIHESMTVREARKIVGQRSPSASGKPGWHELLGMVGDSLTKAQKELAKVEDEVGERKTNAKFREKAGGYAGRAIDIAERLSVIERGPK